jgi:hypothetical protein
MSGQRAHERRKRAVAIRRQRLLHFHEQPVERFDLLAHVVDGLARSNGRAKRSHCFFDTGHKLPIAGAEHRFHWLKPVEIGGKRQRFRFVAISSLIGGEALAQPRSR